MKIKVNYLGFFFGLVISLILVAYVSSAQESGDKYFDEFIEGYRDIGIPFWFIVRKVSEWI